MRRAKDLDVALQMVMVGKHESLGVNLRLVDLARNQETIRSYQSYHNIVSVSDRDNGVGLLLSPSFVQGR